MGSKHSKPKPSHIYELNINSNFAMITSDLLLSEKFKDLSHGARNLYITICVHKNTPEQSKALYMALKELHEDIPEIDLRIMSGQQPRHRNESTLFVIPNKQIKEYGFKASYVTKLKKELMEQGFIEEYAHSKRHNTSNNYDFSHRCTIYRFSNKWKNSS